MVVTKTDEDSQSQKVNFPTSLLSYQPENLNMILIFICYT
jgi:hypothetical protein